MEPVLSLFRLLLPTQILQPILKPFTRLLIGLIAIPAFRLLMRRVVRIQDLDRELEKDLEQWFRGAVLLLIASRNMEEAFFKWVPIELREDHWLLLAGRLLLAMSVIEGMPDQSLFGLIHPGPPPLKLKRGERLLGLYNYLWPCFRGLLCQHLNRASPVLAIMTVFLDGRIGWICYTLAVIQYLVIGLVTSRDRALDVLQQFDNAVRAKRNELVEELQGDQPELTSVGA
jgi:hypothetical protein